MEDIQIIQKLQGLDLSNTDFTEIIHLIDSFKAFPVLAVEIPKGHAIYRARLTEGVDFTTSKEMSYNPVSKSFGRCHFPGLPVFYGSIASEAIKYPMLTNLTEASLILREKLPTEGEFQMSVGKWLVEKPFWLVAIVSDVASNPENKSLLNLAESFAEKLKSYPDPIAAKAIGEYFASEFAKESINSENDYKISAAIANKIYSNGVGGILYPSVQTKGAGFNVAILPFVADECLKLVGVGVHTVYHKNLKSVVDNEKFAHVEIDGTFKLEKMTSDHLGKELALKILKGEVKISDYAIGRLY